MEAPRFSSCTTPAFFRTLRCLETVDMSLPIKAVSSFTQCSCSASLSTIYSRLGWARALMTAARRSYFLVVFVSMVIWEFSQITEYCQEGRELPSGKGGVRPSRDKPPDFA